MDKDYENLGIYDLRNYARSMGVHSPTTLKRNELIDRINQIINGVQPEQKSTNRGRPPKHKANDEYILEFILPDNMFSDADLRYKPIVNSGVRSALAGVLSENFSAIDTESVLFKGFYMEQTADYGIACFKGYLTNYSKENVFVLKSLAETYHLKNGDYLVGEAKYISEKNLYVATKIEYINDIQAEKTFERQNFEDIRPCYPNQKILLGDENLNDFKIIDRLAPLAKGARAVVNIQNQSKKLNIAKHLLNSLSNKNNLRTLLVSINDSPEDIGTIMFECADVEVCKLSATQTREQFFEKVFMYVRNCAKRIECEQDVVIVFYDTKNFVEALAQNIIVSQNVSDNVAKVMATMQLKDLFNMSINSQNGSLTMVLLDADEEFLNIANCVINLKNAPYANTEICLDIKNSYTKNLDKIVGEAEEQKIKDILNQFDENNANMILKLL